ncbi:MAG: heme o synthase [Pyrinomonadaceae bacterium]
MKSFVVEEIERTAGGGGIEVLVPARAVREKLSAYVELTKPRITFLVVLTTAAGFFMGSRDTFALAAFLHAMAATALLSSGIATLNQYMERDLDRLMRRTVARPLPAGLLSPSSALWFGVVLTIVAELYLGLAVNWLSALCGLGVIIGYLFLYTPLKTRTSLSTLVGAFPGAVPPLLGWAAATNSLSVEAWVLFAILFLWQFPHFFAIAWMYREDYERAGIKMLPVVEPDGRLTKQQIVLWTLMLVPVSLAPAVMGMAGAVYFYGALLLGALFLWSSLAAFLSFSNRNARRVLLASVLYLPVLFGLMVLKQ